MQISFCSETEAVLKLPPKLGSEAPIFFPPNFWPQFCFGSFRNDAELKPNVWPKNIPQLRMINKNVELRSSESDFVICTVYIFLKILYETL